MKRQKEYNQCKKSILCIHCLLNEFCMAWVNFVIQHNKNKYYAHFDKRVSLAMPSIRQYVMTPNKVAKHSFYPFIHFTKTMSRYGKKEPKVRELYYCAHLDRCVYQRYAFLLNQKYNKKIKGTLLDDVAIAYRDNLGKNNIDFAKNAFENIKKQNHCVVIVGDFKSFFDRLEHAYLKQKICELLEVDRLPPDYYAVFKNITRYASWDWKLLVEASDHKIIERGIRAKLNRQDLIMTKSQFKEGKSNKQGESNIVKNLTGKGIPQGSPISAILSNIYMLEFDKRVSDYVSDNDGVFMRYSDDFLIVLPYEDKNKTQGHKNTVFSHVSKIDGLELQQDKTKVYVYDNGSIVSFSENKKEAIDYLGFIFVVKTLKYDPNQLQNTIIACGEKLKTSVEATGFRQLETEFQQKNYIKFILVVQSKIPSLIMLKKQNISLNLMIVKQMH